MTTLAVQIDQIAEAFRRRLDAEAVDFVRGYVLHGENRLALETLCDYLCEQDVPIDTAECEKLCELGRELNADLKAGRFTYLQNLVQPSAKPK
jgi:hypothetical protein